MSPLLTKDCFPPPDGCHNCERKVSTFKKNPAGAKDYKRCSGCHMFTYCDKDCQREHWDKVHKHHCRFLSGKTQVKNSKHDPRSCVWCIEERESGYTKVMSGNSPKTSCNIEEDAITMKKKLGEAFAFHEEGKKGHCSLEFSCELPFSLGEVSGQYLVVGSTGLDAMLAHSLKILNTMFFKTEGEKHKYALGQFMNEIILARSQLWYDILIRGMPLFWNRKNLSDQVETIKPIHGASNPWWKCLKFTIDFVQNTNWSLVPTQFDSDRLEDQRFQKFKMLHDYYQSQFQIEAMVCEKQMWANFMLWPEMVNGSLIILLPPSIRCQSCHDELSGEVAITYQEGISKTLPWLVPGVGDDGALMACCSLSKNKNCMKNYAIKDVQARMLSDEDQRKKFLKEFEVFTIESRQCDVCLKSSLSSHRCSACLSVQYCSTVCQMNDLEFHQSVCTTWAKDKSRRIKGKDGHMEEWKSFFANQ